MLRRQRERWFAEHWRIGVIDAPVHELLAPAPLHAVRWLTPREQRGYWADPFGVPGRPDRLYAERYDERTGLGRIEQLELRGDRLVSLGPVLARDAAGHPAEIGAGLHASFPHAFELDGESYVVTETGAARTCVLHRIDEAGDWHDPIVLLSGVAAADPAIFRWDGLLWLACTDTDLGVHDNLCLYWSERLQGPWTAHAANPVKRDRGGARMAGHFFEHGGSLYRPGQDCRSTYGGAVVLYRVEACTPTAYREVPVRTLLPDARGPLPAGLHTVSAWGHRTLIDGKSEQFNAHAVSRKLRTRWRLWRTG